MMMEWLRVLGTVSAFIAFVAICIWAYGGARKSDFERAARLPFADDGRGDDSR
jgi:cytochrome c oxidase cbb3-type subunit IV